MTFGKKIRQPGQWMGIGVSSPTGMDKVGQHGASGVRWSWPRPHEMDLYGKLSYIIDVLSFGGSPCRSELLEPAQLPELRPLLVMS
jgi:hypothetical protein